MLGETVKTNVSFEYVLAQNNICLNLKTSGQFVMECISCYHKQDGTDSPTSL